jgi:hypothetical protein
MHGRLMSTLFNQVTEKDVIHTVNLNAGKLSAGVYICRLQTNAGVTQQQLVLRK